MTDDGGSSGKTAPQATSGVPQLKGGLNKDAAGNNAGGGGWNTDSTGQMESGNNLNNGLRTVMLTRLCPSNVLPANDHDGLVREAAHKPSCLNRSSTCLR